MCTGIVPVIASLCLHALAQSSVDHQGTSSGGSCRIQPDLTWGYAAPEMSTRGTPHRSHTLHTVRAPYRMQRPLCARLVGGGPKVDQARRPKDRDGGGLWG